jgi:uncharacterized membrane protein YgaE (UPF0421/DUF939 family)
MQPTDLTASEKKHRFLLVPIAIVPALMATLGPAAGFSGGLLIGPIFLLLAKGKKENVYMSRFILACILGVLISLLFYVVFPDQAQT